MAPSDVKQKCEDDNVEEIEFVDEDAYPFTVPPCRIRIVPYEILEIACGYLMLRYDEVTVTPWNEDMEFWQVIAKYPYKGATDKDELFETIFNGWELNREYSLMFPDVCWG